MFVSDLSDPLDLVREGLDRLAAEDRSSWSAATRTDRLIELRVVQERIDREVLRAVADCDAVDAWQEAALGGVSWLATKTGLVRNAAAGLFRKRLKRAVSLPTKPQIRRNRSSVRVA